MTATAAAVTEDAAREFLDHRPRLLGIAYRLLGSAWDAEDVVADAYVRWMAADRAEVRSPAAYLTTIVTRLALDQLRSARVRRDSYVGPWLPEPVATAASPSPLGPLDTVERREQVSLATLRMMEALSPPERAVLVLHDAFDLPHAEIAEVLDMSVAGSRQHLHRAHRRVAEARGTPPARPEPEPEPEHDELLARFVAALESADFDAMRELLAADVVAYSDGGGRVRAARHPLVGIHRVMRFYQGIRRRIDRVDVAPVEVNGQTALYGRFGRARLLLAVDVAGGRIREVHTILNPDKLRYLDHQLAGAAPGSPGGDR